jgi:rhamnosyl/mannosyltransferase
MKILQIGKFYPIQGGVEKVMYDLTIGLSQQNIHCDMLCAVIGNQKSGMIQIGKFARIFCMPTCIQLSATMISPAMILKLRKIQCEYDIVHIHHPDPMACLALLLSGYKGKVLLHWHGDILKQKILLKLYRPLQRWLINRADVIVGTTPIYVQHSPFLQKVQDKTTYIPIGVAPLVADPDQVNRIEKQYSGKKIVFSLGRMVEYKGYEYLIKAAQYLDDDHIILIGGGGPLKNKLQQLIDDSEVGEKVKLMGFISDEERVAYFMACDVFVLSSIWKTEAFGIVQIEAMSCGKPVVATRIEGSGVSWVNADGVSGYNVDPRNAEALAGAIRKLVPGTQSYMDFSTRARTRYEMMFTQEKMIDNCLKLYREVLGTEEHG